jgi:Flp pilus assembly protein TadD
LLAKLGRGAEAAGEFETALRLKPDHAQARENLRLLRAEQNKPGSRP